MEYYKVLNDEMNHHGFQFQLGLNTDTSDFNDEECKNGLHFCKKEDVMLWLSYGSKLAFITIPETAKVCHFKDKSKADSIVIKKVIMLRDWSEWENKEFCLEAVKENGDFLGYVNNQTEEMCLEAVKQNGNALYFVKNQTEEICLEAVKRDGCALHYIKNQTEEICLEAVKQNGMTLSFVRNQTEEICLEAVKQNKLALRYVKNKTEKICLEAVK